MDQGTITLTVFDKSLHKIGIVGAPNSVDMVARWNAASDLSFVLDADHVRAGALAQPGARVVAEYFRAGADEATTTVSGVVDGIDGEGDLDEATRTFTIRDDWNELTNLGWPNPYNTVTQQSVSAYDVIKGSTETAVLTAIRHLNDRLKLNLWMPPDFGRGKTITLQLRMDMVSDKIVPALQAAGLGVRIVQRNAPLDPVGSRRWVEIVQPQVYAQELTELSGVISSPSFSTVNPPITRTVVGAGGEDVARIFRQFIRSDLEALTGQIREVFVDARDIDPTDPDLESLISDRSDEAFADQMRTVSLDVTLAEAGAFQFGRTFNLGDTVSIRLAGAPLLTDQVTEVEITEDTDNGLLVTPKVGSMDDSTDAKVISVVAAIEKNLRALQRRY